MSNDFSNRTAADLGRAMERGELDAREVCEDFLARIESHPDAENIYARTTPERARTEADASSNRAKSGMRRGLLDGVPISWKDLFDTAGVATEAGSRLLSGRVPEADAEVVVRATNNGMICLGKTHLSELAFSGLGVNPITATAPNAVDASCAPGGSSSGSAVSVATGLAAATVGSDTGGSVRIPAAWNDLVGLKTTHGVVPMDGAVPLCRRLDTAGPLCLSVEDAALLFGVLATNVPQTPDEESVSGCRLMVLNTDALGPTSELPARALLESLPNLESLGAIIEDGALPYLADADALSACLYAVEAYGIWRDTIEASPETMFSQILARFRTGARFSGPDYVAAWERLLDYRRRAIADLRQFDALILPTVPIVAPPVDRLLSDPEYFVQMNLLAVRNTRISNLLDWCAITIPTRTPGCGFMIMAPPHQERTILRIALALERSLAN